MGQRTFALMFGIEDSADFDMCGDSGDNGLIGEWETACADKIRAFEAKHPRKTFDDPYGKDVYVPDVTYEGAITVIGFYIAVGASGKRGVSDLEAVAIGDIKATYADDYKAARRRWRRFSKWCAAKGVALPKGRLFLADTEVA